MKFDILAVAMTPKGKANIKRKWKKQISAEKKYLTADIE